MQKLNTVSQKYKLEIEKAVSILKEEGCREVYLFGSIANGSAQEKSDIDLAVKGCPSGKYFNILGKLIIELEYPVDLINLDKKDLFSEHLQKEGELIYVS